MSLRHASFTGSDRKFLRSIAATGVFSLRVGRNIPRHRPGRGSVLSDVRLPAIGPISCGDTAVAAQVQHHKSLRAALLGALPPIPAYRASIDIGDAVNLNLL